MNSGKEEGFMRKAGMLESWGWRSGRVGLGVLAITVALGAGEPVVQPPEIPEVSRRINAFTFDLLHRHAARTNVPANAVLSAQSIYHGLAMSYVASGGKTRAELSRALHFPDADKLLMKDLGNLRRQLVHAAPGGAGARLDLTNSGWLDEKYADFQEDYLKMIERAFGAALHRVSFADKKIVADRINRHISDVTHGRIQRVVGPEDFASRSGPDVIDEPALVLVNAIWFKGSWACRFDKAATTNMPFHIDASINAPAAMMRQQTELPYAEDATCQFLELPYENGEFSMYVLLPKEPASIGKWIAGVNAEQVLALKGKAFAHSVDVALPKFETRDHLGLKQILSELGVREAFESRGADFDQMIHKREKAFRIYISNCLHDAWVRVDEEGSEAAAATTTVHYSIGCSAPSRPRPILFHADHPFLYLIVHNQSRSILFSGWFSEPREQVGDRK
ncbi:MAG: serpin family protein [Kiritimatiellia bacterium]